MSICEIGFGNGNLLGYLKQCGHDVYGIEVQNDLVSRATRSGYRAGSNFGELDKSKFDLIIALDVLEHIHHSQLFNFVDEIKKNLNDQGTFIARFPNGDSPLALNIQHGDVTHLTAIGSGKIKHLASASGFKSRYLGGDLEPFTASSYTKRIRKAIAIVPRFLFRFILKMFFDASVERSFFSINLLYIGTKG
jgi:SAM-dependent methyltransferase